MAGVSEKLVRGTSRLQPEARHSEVPSAQDDKPSFENLPISSTQPLAGCSFVGPLIESQTLKRRRPCAHKPKMAPRLVVPAGETFFDIMKHSFDNVPVGPAPEQGISTAEFLDAAESFIKLFRGCCRLVTGAED